MKYLNLLLFAWLLGCQYTERTNVILDVKSIVHNTPEETEALIGKPDSTYSYHLLGKVTFCQYYKANNIEIQYPAGQATDIVIYKAQLPFNQSALDVFGIDYGKKHPSEFIKNKLIRWTDFDEFATISFYNTKLDSSDKVLKFDIFFKAKAKE